MIITLVDSRDPGLAPWILGYAATELEPERRAERRVVPARPNCFLHVTLAGRQTIIDIQSGDRVVTPQVCLFGPLSHYSYDMECADGFRSFRIRLQPAAAGRLFGIDPVALADTFQPFDLPDGLLRALHGAADYADMGALCDEWIATLVASRLQECAIARAARLVRERRGQVSIGTLHEGSGLSVRHFQRRFKAMTGQNPKHYARVCRVAHAVWMKECDADLPWTAIAVEVGYADQSHFIRDFKALTGMIPRDFVRHLPQFTALRLSQPARTPA